MKPADIRPGWIYHDGKDGLRLVLAIRGAPSEVEFRSLIAKTEREYVSGEGMRSTIGHEGRVQLASFCSWAEVCHAYDDGMALLLRMRAAKVKLSPGELAYMTSVKAECTGLVNTYVSHDQTEVRAVAGLVRKGMLKFPGGGEAGITELGAALLETMGDASGDEPRDRVREASR